MSNRVISISDYQNTSIAKSFVSGEGSRGGKVIGHTRSGRAVYDIHDHPSHSIFTSADHEDAIRHQSLQYHDSDKSGNRHYALGNKNEAVGHYKQREEHHSQIKEHRKLLYEHYLQAHPVENEVIGVTYSKQPMNIDTSKNTHFTEHDHIKAIDEFSKYLERELPVVDSKDRLLPLTRAQHIKRAHILNAIKFHQQQLKNFDLVRKQEEDLKQQEMQKERAKRYEAMEQEANARKIEAQYKVKEQTKEEFDPYKRHGGGHYRLD